MNIYKCELYILCLCYLFASCNRAMSQEEVMHICRKFVIIFSSVV
jgi:hypothetical protein